ncbi:hypothetical protein FBZ96_102142 [Bradyrhizobium stylosanthis]|uniref:Uncharacterized protein n=1 Tax=Bradyrhizobium stylosanthis TaxID=1803665 RepID=A0A560E2S5_9BRAD|nr:hypothetical protein FBZ96_102142 [Bradyrhizobium stylosanthis]
MHRIMEPTMADLSKVFPEPHTTKLRRICLAQIVVSVSTLTSTAVLVSCLAVVLRGFN